MNKKINLFEIRMYLLIALLMFYYLIFRKGSGAAQSFVYMLYIYVFVIRLYDILLLSHFSKHVKRQIQAAIFPTFIYIALVFNYSGFINSTTFIFIVLIFIFMPTKFLIFSKKMYFEKYLVPIYLYCKRKYFDLLFVLIVHFFFLYTGLLELPCSPFTEALATFIFLLIISILWFLLTYKIKLKKINELFLPFLRLHIFILFVIVFQIVIFYNYYSELLDFNIRIMDNLEHYLNYFCY